VSAADPGSGGLSGARVAFLGNAGGRFTSRTTEEPVVGSLGRADVDPVGYGDRAFAAAGADGDAVECLGEDSVGPADAERSAGHIDDATSRTGIARSIPDRALASSVSGSPCQGPGTGLPPPISTSVPGTPGSFLRNSPTSNPARGPTPYPGWGILMIGSEEKTVIRPTSRRSPTSWGSRRRCRCGWLA
jgi:hypothetical protein